MRTVLNELIAFGDLAKLNESSSNARSFVIAELRPLRVRQHQLDRHPARRDRVHSRPIARHDLARLGVRALLAGTLANFLPPASLGFLL